MGICLPVNVLKFSNLYVTFSLLNVLFDSILFFFHHIHSLQQINHQGMQLDMTASSIRAGSLSTTMFLEYVLYLAHRRYSLNKYS